LKFADLSCCCSCCSCWCWCCCCCCCCDWKGECALRFKLGKSVGSRVVNVVSDDTFLENVCKLKKISALSSVSTTQIKLTLVAGDGELLLELPR
jgi:hypothetical protein